jgi:hypothetical protein
MKAQINSFGGAATPPDSQLSVEEREDERSRALARRARLGDYDEGMLLAKPTAEIVLIT